MSDVVAAGATTNIGTGLDFTVVKFDGMSGAELWRQIINGTTNGSDMASAVTLDGAGNVVAAGSTFNTDTDSDFTVIKFNGVSGAELWHQHTKGTRDGASAATRITMDGVGNVVAIGNTFNIGTKYADFTVIKFDGVSGAELWRRLISGSDNGGNGASGPAAITVDGAGNAVAAGFTVNARLNPDFTVVKLDWASGIELWRQVIAGTAHGVSFNSATAVAVDGVGDVVAAGRIINTTADFIVIKFDGASGTELWRQVINGAANGADQALSVAVDSKGNVVAAGRMANTGTSYDLTVVKFDGISGTELWHRVIPGAAGDFSAPLVITLDAAGNVVAAGGAKNSGTDDDFTVIKLKGADGRNF